MESTRLKVLLVEDLQIIQMVVKNTLADLNWDIEVSDTGHKAVELAINKNYDLVLMDIGLPDISGIEATQLIRQHKPDLPIIALTAHNDMQHYNSAMSAGMNAFIIKPVSIEKVEGVLEASLCVGAR